MKVCYFGLYRPEYCRNKNIILGLKAVGVEVVEVQDRTPGLKKLWYLYKKHKALKENYDVMIVGFPGQMAAVFAKCITRKPIVFDLHVSLYDSVVYERKATKPYKPKGIYAFFLDWLSCTLADRVLMDTNAHADYVSALLHIPRKKVLTVYHGADVGLFQPVKVEKTDEPMIISFHGYIQKLTGTEYVLQAMNLIKDEPIELNIIGGGELYKDMQALAGELDLKKVHFYPPMKPAELIPKICEAHVVLGLFGKGKKGDRVIANKIFEGMSLHLPVITGESAAVSEHFKHKEHIYYCPVGDSEAIARGFVELKNNPQLRQRIAEYAIKQVEANFTPDVLGRKLLPQLEELV